MTADNVRDFDAFWAEKDEAEGTPATIAVRFEGREYFVPASPSATVMLRIARIARDGTDKVDMNDVLVMAEGLLGRAVVDQISSTSPGLTAEKLMGFLQWVGEMQTGTASPNRETRRANQRRQSSTSSRRGASSRRTSSASTGSTSASV